MTDRTKDGRITAQFDSRATCREWLREHVWIGSEVESRQDTLLEAFTDACEIRDNGDSHTLDLRLRRWIVRNDDLEIFGAVATAVAALFSANFVLGDLSVASLSGLVMGLFKLIRDARRRGGWLTPDQILVVAVLESHRARPLAVSEIASMLSTDRNCRWTGNKVRAELHALTQLPTRSGLLQLVEKNSKGEWLMRDA